MKRQTKALQRKNGEHGQVLILAVVALLLVVIAVLLLFDVQNVIAGKIRGQNGVDAAALTGAEWQKHSLNLIGELNLVRATGMLISDPFLAPGVEDIAYNLSASINGMDVDLYPDAPGPTQLKDFTKFPEENEFRNPDGSVDIVKLVREVIRVDREISYLANLDDLVSQLQTRISFVGPLIGFGAAQQAAKNNGLMYRNEQNDTNEMFFEYLKILRDNGDIFNDEDLRYVNDYDWHGHYLDMLYSILGYNGSNGIAVGTKFKFLGMPVFASDPPTELAFFLGNKYIYQSIRGRNWCELDPILDLDFSGNWWSSFEKGKNGNFSKQSEILPLHIDFSRGSRTEGRRSSELNASSPYAIALDVGALARYVRDDELFSSVFNSEVPYEYEVTDYSETYEITEKGRRKNYNTKLRLNTPLELYNDEDAGRLYNLLPILSWAVFDEEWRQYGDYQKEWAKDCLRGTGFLDGMDYQSGALAYFETKQQMVTVSGSGSLGRPRRGSYMDKIETNAEAKPIGRIKTKDGYLRPFEAGRMVLPVFTKTALIPIALEQVDGISMGDIDWYYYLTEFVPLLSDSSSIDEAWERANKPGNHRGYYESYKDALKDLDNPEFRKRGLDWLNSPSAWAKDENGIRRPIRTRRDDCNVEGSDGPRPAFSLH